MALPATDSFTETSDTALSSHGTGGWTYAAGTFTVIGADDGVTGSTSDVEECAYWTADSFNAAHYAQVVKVGAGTVPHGPAVQCSGTGATARYYGWYGTGGGVSYIFRVNGGTGTWTDIGTIGGDIGGSGSVPTWTSGKTYRLEVDGTGTTVTLTAKEDGVVKFTRTDSSTSRITTAGAAGITAYGSQVGAALDDFEGGNLSSALTQSATDTVTLSENIAVTGAYAPALFSDTATVTDTASGQTADVGGTPLTQTAGDDVTATDAIPAVTGAFAPVAFADTVTLAENLAVLGAYAPALFADQVTATDAIVNAGTTGPETGAPLAVFLVEQQL